MIQRKVAPLSSYSHLYGTCTSQVCFIPLRTPQNESLLLLAVKHKLEMVADHLCEVLGSELSVADSKGNSPIWVALRSRQETIAAKLVSWGVKRSCLWPTARGTAPSGWFSGAGRRPLPPNW